MEKSYISYKIIGRHIRTARKRLHLTQESIAEMMHITVAHYGRLERGEREISLDRLAEVSVLLKTPIEQLLTGSIPLAENIIAENEPELTFQNQMSCYTKYCREETLQRMLRICEVLAREDTDQKMN